MPLTRTPLGRRRAPPARKTKRAPRTPCQNCQKTPGHLAARRLLDRGCDAMRRRRASERRWTPREKQDRDGFWATARRRGRRKKARPPVGAEACESARSQLPEKCLSATIYLSLPNTANRPICGAESLGFAGLRRWGQQSQRTQHGGGGRGFVFSCLNREAESRSDGSFLQKAVSEDNLSLAEAATWRSSGEYL